MSLISRITTWTANQILTSTNLNGEFNNIVNLLNNIDAGTTNFTNCNSTSSTITTATVTTLANTLQKYRRPVLQYNSSTVVNIETGINGTSGQLGIMFPDGTYRTDSTTTRIQCNTAQVAALTSTAQSGLRTGTVASNTWYAVYAVKSQVNTTDIVAVADTVIPTQANYATLNTNFGTNGWVYLGMFLYGFGWGGTMDSNIAKFVQAGNRTVFGGFTANNAGGSNATTCTWKLVSATGAATATWAYAAGTGAAQIPGHISMGTIVATTTSGTGVGLIIQDSGGNCTFAQTSKAGGAANLAIVRMPDVSLLGGFKTSNTAAENETQDISLAAYVDGVLGVGSNAIL